MGLSFVINDKIISNTNEYLDFCTIIEKEVLDFLNERNSYISIRSFNKWFRDKYGCTVNMLKNTFVKNFPTFSFETHPYIIHNIKAFFFVKYGSFIDYCIKYCDMSIEELYNKLLEKDPLIKGLSKATVKSSLYEIGYMS